MRFGKGVRRPGFRLTAREKKKRKKANNLKYRPTKEQSRLYLRAWREKNKERQAEINRRAKQKAKEKALKDYIKRVKYERTHKEVRKKYYLEHKAEIYAQKKRRLEKQKAT